MLDGAGLLQIHSQSSDTLHPSRLHGTLQVPCSLARHNHEGLQRLRYHVLGPSEGKILCEELLRGLSGQ